MSKDLYAPLLGRVVLLALVLLAPACGGSSSDAVDDPGRAPALVAGSVLLAPAAGADWVAGLDLDRLGVGPVTETYDLTTPADEPFSFDVLSRRAGNAGVVRVSVAHVADDGVAPAGGPATLASAGFVASGAGRSTDGVWMDAVGDGFSRITLRGRVDRDHVLAVQADDGDGDGTALVRVRLGPPSAIYAGSSESDEYPGVLDDATIYSSDAWTFGLPTVAVSGDRTSVVCYEGDRGNPDAWVRYEMRLQHDAGSGLVTGGGSEETSSDSGNWRDHEIAALYNVLALAHGGADAVALSLSFDRGATFAQTETFGQGDAAWRPRLVQVAMALDYTLALLYWRSNVDGSSDLVLVEGHASAFDGVGSPIAYEFDAPVVVHHEAGDVTPAIMSATYSAGGDLVIAYAFSSFRTLPDMRWESLTQNRCVVRPFGGELRDVLVEEDRIVGKDPSVAVLGQGETLRIFYAYEAQDGVRLRVSEDGGLTFSAPTGTLEPGAHMPTVIARPGDDGTLLDLLYLAFGPEGGMEIHLLHWDAFSVETAPKAWRLTRATFEGEILPPPLPGGGAVPEADVGVLPPVGGFSVTQVAWLGYDAALDGDEIVIVYDEETYDSFYYFDAPFLGARGDVALGGAPGAEDGFEAVEPPPLAPGMSEEVPEPDEGHRHQLRLIRVR